MDKTVHNMLSTIVVKCKIDEIIIKQNLKLIVKLVFLAVIKNIIVFV